MVHHPAGTESPPTPGTTQDITFVPVNQSRSPDGNKARRGYQSCDNCRDKKKRCDLSAGETTCSRCLQESRTCLTTHRRKRRKTRPVVGGTTPTVLRTAESEVTISAATPTTGIIPPSESRYSPTQRDIQQRVPDENTCTPQADSAQSGNLHWAPNTKQQILSTSILDARDALDLIAVAGSRESVNNDGLNSEDLHHSHKAVSHLPPDVRPATVRLAPSWDRFFLVKRGIIQPHEAVEYLDFYFSQLWHLFQVIPECYSSPDQYGSLVAEEPVLTISLVTIASRYHPLSGFNGQARSERIHWRTWPWVQRIFQSSMWGSSAMRSLGAIAALLLFIEWHPRAINSPEDLISDYGESELFEPQSQIPGPEGGPQHMPEPAETYRRSDPSSIPERLNIVAPAYRSNKMSWMLLSTAISLAREIGCLNEEQVLGRTSSRAVAETNSDRLEWTRILTTFLRLTDEALALRLRLEPHFTSSGYMDIIDHLPSSLMADGFLESTVELATHMRKARELLHSWRKNQQGTGPAVPITAWDSCRRGLDRWERQHRLSGTDPSLRGACLDIEYYYVRLCGLSPAAHMFESSPETQASNFDVESLSQFASEATKASVNILELAVTLKTEDQLDSTNPYIGLIMRVVDATRQGAPDDIHMSQRYATLLDILVNAALRTSSNIISQSSGKAPNSHSNPHLMGSMLVDSNDLDLGDDWIYDSNFWDTLPDMVGLNSVPNLIMPSFE